MSYKIEKMDCMPPVPNNKGITKYPFASMEVGEKLEIPNLERNPPESMLDIADKLANVRSHVSRWNKKHPETKFYCSILKERPWFITIWRAE